MNATEALTKVTFLKGKLQASRDLLREKQDSLGRTEDKIAATEEFRAVVLRVASETQGKLVLRFETIVQAALDAIFPGEYKFRLEFVQKRGRTEVDIWLDRDGIRMNPLDSNGGGVVDVLSIALRICCLTLSSMDRVLILDEPFKHLRGDAREKLGGLLTMLSDKLGIQVLMVADVAGAITNGKVFQVTKKDGVSVISERSVDLRDDS